jgi:hypothetical protein
MFTKRLFVALPIILTMAVNASAADDILLKAKLRPCIKDGVGFGEVGSCGKVWKLASGEVTLRADGKIEIDLKGLVLNDSSTGEFNGTSDGVTHIVPTLVCGGSESTIAATGERGALRNPKGDAPLETTLSLPDKCTAPVLLLREVYEGKVGGWLASTGF